MSRILIIEDNPVVLQAYRKRFEASGYAVAIAADGETGVETVPDFRPDIVLVDLGLPKMNGVDVIRQIRRMPDFRKIPVIVFSNGYFTELVNDAWMAGATRCLSKIDYSPKQIVDFVAETLESVQSGKGDVFELSFETESLENNFMRDAATYLRMLQEKTQLLAQETTDTSTLLKELATETHKTCGNASMISFNQIARVTEAFEAFLTELSNKPEAINVSTRRTIANAIDFLSLALRKPRTDAVPSTPQKVLVIDDEEFSRRAIVTAVRKAKLEPMAIADGSTVLDMLDEHAFSLVITDIEMPHVNGYQVCERIRKHDRYHSLPVIFVTSLSDFTARARSNLSGGNEFIAKPFLFMELALKSILLIEKHLPPATS